MSLVDYASSSDDDEGEGGGGVGAAVIEDRGEEGKHEPEVQLAMPSSPPIDAVPRNLRHGSSPYQLPEIAAQLPSHSFEKLPDASILLNSPALSMSGNSSDHSSRVAAAMAESASRKRDSNGLPSTSNRCKLPKGNLLHSKNIPDTVGGLLVPPQLTGRSNVVTEDVGKLFVRKHPEPSSH